VVEDTVEKASYLPGKQRTRIGVADRMQDLDNIEFIVIIADVGLIEHGIPDFRSRVVYLMTVYKHKACFVRLDNEIEMWPKERTHERSQRSDLREPLLVSKLEPS
jgi:hypothetical protein